MNPNVLFVDDEISILKAVKRCLRDLDINLFVSESGLEGLETMASTQMQVVVADIRMPHMNGVQFLRKARKIQPHAVYMVLSGYADIDNVLAAVNTLHVWRFITKPWQETELQIAVKNALELAISKAGEKRLKRELVQVSAKLATLNKTLEHRVAKRTHTLHARNEILQMMIADMNVEKIIERICVEMAREYHIERLLVDVDFMEAVFSNSGRCRLDGDLARLCRTARQTGATVNDAHGCATPLIRDNQTLGVCLSADPVLDHSKAKGWISLLTLCLIQAKSMQDAPELVETIDRLLEAF